MRHRQTTEANERRKTRGEEQETNDGGYEREEQK